MTGSRRDSSSVSRATIHKFRPQRSITPDSKTASRDPAAVHAPHSGDWRLLVADAFAGELTRGIVESIPETAESENATSAWRNQNPLPCRLATP
jgi:hypothetical protein